MPIKKEVGSKKNYHQVRKFDGAHLSQLLANTQSSDNQAVCKNCKINYLWRMQGGG